MESDIAQDNVMIIYRPDYLVPQLSRLYPSIDNLELCSSLDEYQHFLKDIFARYAGSEKLKKFVDYTDQLVKHVYTNLQARGNMPLFNDFKAEALGFSLNNLHEWAKAALANGLYPIAVNWWDLELSLLAPKNPETLGLGKHRKKGISAINLCMMHGPLSESNLELIVKEGIFPLGYDREINKINFSIIPFLIEEYFARKEKGDLGVLSGFMSAGSDYESTVQDFFKSETNIGITSMFPRFASIPRKAVIDLNVTERLYSFFKDKDIGKVIVKGNFACASGQNVPYIILDTRLKENQSYEDKISEWIKALDIYSKKSQMDFMIQELIDSETAKAEEISGIRPLAIDFGTTVARKHNVVGHHIWDTGIKYVYFTNLERYKNTKPQKIIAWSFSGKVSLDGIVLGVVPSTSRLDVDQLGLGSIGRLLNLISPFGGHSLDIVVEKNNGKAYALEANPSSVRGDHIGTNFFTGCNIFVGYMEWVSDIIAKKQDTSGMYTQKMFFEYCPEKRAEYISALHNMWTFVQELIETTILFCDYGRFIEFRDFKVRQDRRYNSNFYDINLYYDNPTYYKMYIIDNKKL